MSNLIVRYESDGVVRWGRIEGDAPRSPADTVLVHPFADLASSTSDMIAAIDPGSATTLAPVSIPAEQLLSPITPTSQIFCQGLNYAPHAAEAQHFHRKSNLIFSKASSSLNHPFGDIVRPSECELLDYEVEFGLVFRQDIDGRVEITPENVGDYVAGIVLANDVSARDMMFGATFMQWFYGKSPRTFCPVGPAIWMLEPAEVQSALENIEVSLTLNGELRQKATSSELIFKPIPSINHVARQMDLRRGDILLTGTPGGITSGASERLIQILRDQMMDDETRLVEMREEWAKPRPFMQPGDICACELRDLKSGQFLGGIQNRVAAA
jgi:2-keto-4-pentenoate hydratase/2-oxohepta-3-ene-1,7-dioic acid hydratase in catechol pathway